MKRVSKIVWIIPLFVVLLLACRASGSLNSSTSEPVSELQPTLASAATSAPILAQVPLTEGQGSTEAASLPQLVDLEDRLVQVYESANPGVVAIQILSVNGGGLGSGFVIDKEGHILTNLHVVEGYTDLEVDFPSGLKTRGQVLGEDTDSDLAVIKVDVPAEELHPLPLGDSSSLKVGQTVVAIGNPFGLSSTMTTGIISALGRTLDSMREAPSGDTFTAGDIIQTDTAINPGNSGGPLLNLDGEVVGVNRAIRTFNFTTTEEPLNSGIGFAIAINIVKRVIPALISEGNFDYPYIGITSMDEISLLEQEALELPRAVGAYITEVTSGGPAAKAGLRGGRNPTDLPGILAGGDLIIAIDDRPVNNFADLLSYLINYRSPGDTVTLTILRDNQEMDVELTLDKRP